MLQDAGSHWVWTKGDDEPLTTHFRTSEFSCHCSNADCVTQQVDKGLLTRLETLRASRGQPVPINSGFRCEAYEAQLGDEGLEIAEHVTQHALGMAADVGRTPGDDMPQSVEPLFDAIGVANTFVHVDMRPPHADGTKLRWSYK
jgi:hypothetical protein